MFGYPNAEERIINEFILKVESEDEHTDSDYNIEQLFADI